MKKLKRKYRMIWIVVLIVSAVVAGGVVFLNQPGFGRLPRGERLARIERSPNYRDGQFRNLLDTPVMTQDKGALRGMWDFLSGKKDSMLRPRQPLPAVKTDLHRLDPGEDVLVWFGHSSYFIQLDGKRFLIDPVLTSRWPMSLMFSPFDGTDVYAPGDMPGIDYLMITHDHWDHLDYHTVTQMRERIGQVVCGLGVGEHFEAWGFDAERILELDWNESVTPENGLTIDCLPARHFSGRGLRRNRSLWVSYMLRTPSMTIYLDGDTGYGDHFAEVARRFPQIDLIVLENGQYNSGWRYIHTMPHELGEEIGELRPGRVLTVHNSKFALSKHAWDEPLRNASREAERNGFDLLTPTIGEPVRLKDTAQTFRKWWENLQ